jgi:hypothetical protein
MQKIITVLISIMLASMLFAQDTASAKIGVPVSYQLPTTGPLPKTYLVTLAIVDPKNTDWIISQFASGVVRTVTAENGGKFIENWNGLDDNYMPVPPGDYAVKGIYTPAHKWPANDEWHAITPKFFGGISGWLPSPDDWKAKEPFGGDPVGSPLMDIAVSPNGIAVFYYGYLENGLNSPMVDLKKPVGYDQFIRAFGSGGAAGGSSAVTDGEMVWAFSTDGGPKYVYRTDGRTFGNSPSANRRNSYLPDGWVTSMAIWSNPTVKGKNIIYVAQRGKIINKNWYQESNTEFVNKITVHNGDNGTILATIPISQPQAISVIDDTIYALSTDNNKTSVISMKLKDGIPVDSTKWNTIFEVPAKIKPSDMKVDSKERFYLSDTRANKVYQLDATGKITRTFGKLDEQKPGTYDKETFMSPTKLASWKDEQGNDRLLVVESAGPNRVTEWNAETGAYIRDFPTYQTKANDSYGIDPEHPEDMYLPTHNNWLTRYKINYEKHTFTIDAVWPNVGNNPLLPGMVKPVAIRTNNNLYLAGGRSWNIYRYAGDKWLLSAGIVLKDKNQYLWHDNNGNGQVDNEELTPTSLPGHVLIYHGQNWLTDLSFLAIAQGGRDVWRLTPTDFDQFGNPIYKEWKKQLTDSVFEAKAKGTADAIHGGNEVSDSYNSDWCQVDGSDKEGFYVQARGGGFDANFGHQFKISYYEPKADGTFQMKWRTGRTALRWAAKPGEIYGAMRIRKPINGLISVIDQSRCGILLYNQDGLYVDTLFPGPGVYALPGEFFAGFTYANKDNGKIYFAVGKYTPMIYEAEGWSLKDNPVTKLTTIQKTVTIAASQIASPPDIVLSIRGGAGKANVALISPALGGANMDGSMDGWESCRPITFIADDKQNVEVRCLYDTEHLYLRWHARLANTFEAKPLPPLPRIFTHDQLADTLSFYIQGDVNATPGKTTDGRPGDARFVFGIFKNGDKTEPVGIGMYPTWTGKTPATPQIYRTGQLASFAHVGAIDGATYNYTIDKDSKGFVLLTSIPRAAIPALDKQFGSDLRTMINFSATYGGHTKFWWANSDLSASTTTYDEPTEAKLYPGSWAPVSFQGIADGITIRNWLKCGPFGGPGAENFQYDPNPDSMKEAVKKLYSTAVYPPDDGKVDLKAVYSGEMTRGFWGNPQVKWTPTTINDLDTRFVMGGAQVYYGATWVYSPTASDVEFEFQSHPMTFLKWTLNDKVIDPGKYTSKVNDGLLTASKTVTLAAGWNKVIVRSFCIGYSPCRAGIVIKGTPDKLWPLKLSATPQVEQVKDK